MKIFYHGNGITLQIAIDIATRRKYSLLSAIIFFLPKLLRVNERVCFSVLFKLPRAHEQEWFPPI